MWADFFLFVGGAFFGMIVLSMYLFHRGKKALERFRNNSRI